MEELEDTLQFKHYVEAECLVEAHQISAEAAEEGGIFDDTFDDTFE